MSFVAIRFAPFKNETDEVSRHLINKDGEEQFVDELRCFQDRVHQLRRINRLLSVVAALLGVALVIACYYGANIRVDNFLPSTPVPISPLQQDIILHD